MDGFDEVEAGGAGSEVEASVDSEIAVGVGSVIIVGLVELNCW